VTGTDLCKSTFYSGNSHLDKQLRFISNSIKTLTLTT